MMKNGLAIIVIILSACASTPGHEAWKLSLETPNPPGSDGNCLPVAQALQDMYGGEIAVLSHPDNPKEYHVVLMVKDDWVLDNGTVGYSAHWDDVVKKGWRFEYWWRP